MFPVLPEKEEGGGIHPYLQWGGGGECNAYRYVSEGDFEGARGENLV